MSLTLIKPKLDNLAGDIWKSAEGLRGKFKTYEYQGVILPIIVIRRLECVLLAWRHAKQAEVLAKRPRLTEQELAKLVKELERNPPEALFTEAHGEDLGDGPQPGSEEYASGLSMSIDNRRQLENTRTKL
jgi:type I restriction-modification system DNA methylase subunit